jgi:hypothetical protein
MKKFKLILIVLAVLLIIGIINRAFNGKQIDKRNAERDSLAIVEANAPKVDKYVAYADTLKQTEKKIKDAYINSAKVLYISVYDDGTIRNGLAEYFCQRAKNDNIEIRRVKIVKFGLQSEKEKDTAYGKLLGESACN